MSIATLGPAGTFSHELAQKLYGDDIDLLPTIRALMERVASGSTDGIVPIENSEAGGVGATLQGLADLDILITGEAYMPIRHHLAAREDPARLSVIYAHPQTHEQCSVFLEKIGVAVVHTSSNAASAVAMRENDSAGAIISQMAADLYSLPIAVRDVQNNALNITRFVRISSRPATHADCTKCSLIIDPRTDRIGLLADILGVLARRRINLTRIESRPSRREMGEYIFFVDFELSDGWREAREELEGMTRVKELGCYGRLEVQG